MVQKHSLLKKKRKFSSYVRKFRWDRVQQSHIWLIISSYMTKYLRIFSYIRKPFLIHDFAPDPFCISIYMRNCLFFINSVCSVYSCICTGIVLFFTTHVCDLCHGIFSLVAEGTKGEVVVPLLLFNSLCNSLCMTAHLRISSKKELYS